ncbi:MAG: VWA domain-containing protein, partial [Gemmataceae bacterium]
DWPRLPSFLPFLHELLRHATTRPDRHTADVGTTLEEFLPPSTVGTTATVTPPEGASFPSPVFAADDGALVRVPETLLSGIYRVQLSGQKPSLFAVNPSASRGTGAESDLRRIDPAELKALGNGVQVVREVGQIQLTSSDSGQLISTPRPHGPTIARWLIIVGLGLLVGEVLLAWQMGPGRQFLGVTSAPRTQEEAPRRLAKWLPRLLALVPLLLAIAVIFSILRAQTSGVLLDDWPESWRRSAEAAVGVPGAGPGEGTHWRLETATVFSSRVDRWAIPLVGIFAVILTLMAYYAEARAASSLRRLAWPFLLRLAAIGVAVFLILPQVRLAFDREGWPDVAILIDRSASMSTIDAITDPTLLAKTEELSKLAGVPAADRLLLAKTVLAHPQRQTLERLLSERQVKIHLYSIGPEATLLAEVDDPTGLPAAREAINALKPDGTSSRLGDHVEGVLKAFRGGSLAAMVLLTDGITTNGDDLSTAARTAARANVPLYTIAVGDAQEPQDVAIGDARADEVVAKNDEWIFEARLNARGPQLPKSIVVTLSEQQGSTLVRRAEVTVTLDPQGKPVPVRLKHIPTDIGEKEYIIEATPTDGEKDRVNNRIVRRVSVTDNKKLRVLYIEATPRYEYRFLKVLLEREIESGRSVRAFELQTLLLDASKDYA